MTTAERPVNEALPYDRAVPELRSQALDGAPKRATYAAPRAATGVEWSTRLSPDDSCIWMTVSELRDAATLEWSADHSDDGVYVVSGALEIDGRVVPADGALIVESGAACTARAVGPTEVVHCGARDAEPPNSIS